MRSNCLNENGQVIFTEETALDNQPKHDKNFGA